MMTTYTANTTRFGEVEYSPEDIVLFNEGVLGFPQCRQYLIIQHSDDSPYRWLQNVEEGELAFLVVDPAAFLANYAPEMPLVDAKALEITDETPRLVYTIVTIPPGKPENLSLNLAGPIVINAATRRAKQVVLDSEQYPVRYRPVKEAKKAQQAA